MKRTSCPNDSPKKLQLFGNYIWKEKKSMNPNVTKPTGPLKQQPYKHWFQLNDRELHMTKSTIISFSP